MEIGKDNPYSLYLQRSADQLYGHVEAIHRIAQDLVPFIELVQHMAAVAKEFERKKEDC